MTASQSLQGSLDDFFHSNLAFSEITKLIVFLCWVPVAPQDIKHIELNQKIES